MFKKNAFKFFSVLGLAFCSLVALVSCGNGNDKDNTTKYDVTFYDESTILKTVEVEEGQKVERPTELETKEGYTFINWFATASKNHVFDFDKAINENVRVYAGFSLYKTDNREWYVVGSGQSPLLTASSWGKNIGPSFAMTKTASNKNEFKITMDVIAGDEFQFAGPDWIHKRGFGYLISPTINSKTYFEGQGGGYGDVVAKGRNIKALISGNYTFTLNTYPADDTYDTTNPSYTEEQKEIHNMGTYDTISWVRNKDAEPLPTSVTNWYIKGKNITSWASIHTEYTKFTKIGNTYTLDVFLTTADEIMFNSFATNLETGVEGPQIGYINGGSGTRSVEFDALFDLSGSNFVPKQTGTYQIIVDAAGTTPAITATYKEVTPEIFEHDFYVNGTFLEKEWGAVTNDAIDVNYKLAQVENTHTYVYKNLELSEGDEILIQTMKAGSTVGAGNWGIKLDYKYLITPNDNCEAASSTNTNIKMLKSGTYDITIDVYSRTVKIALQGNDIYIKGAFDACGNGTNWLHGHSETLKLTEVANHAGIYILELEVNNLNGGDLSFGLEVFDLGSQANGVFVGKGNIGTEGISAQCVTDASNLKFPSVGTYFITYNTVTKTMNVYTSNPYA